MMIIIINIIVSIISIIIIIIMTIVLGIIIINVLIYYSLYAIFCNNHFTYIIVWEQGPLDKFLNKVIYRMSENKTKWNEMRNPVLYSSLSRSTYRTLFYLLFSFPQLSASLHSPDSCSILFSHLYFFFTCWLNFFAKLFPSYSWVLGPVLFGLFFITKGFSGRAGLYKQGSGKLD